MQVWEKRGPSNGKSQFKGPEIGSCWHVAGIARRSVWKERSQQGRVEMQVERLGAGHGVKEWIGPLGDGKDLDFPFEKWEPMEDLSRGELNIDLT